MTSIRAPSWLLGLLLASALTAVLPPATTAVAAGPSKIVHPPPRIPLAFSHPGHMKLGMKCTSCHPSALKSIDAADNLLPKEAVCTTCHRLDAPNPARAFPKSSCDTCHPGFKGKRGDQPAAVVLPTPRLRMTHRSHTLLGILCTDCHTGLENLTSPPKGGWSKALPSMSKCLECHDGNSAPSQCTTCHLASDDGRLVTSFPEGKLAPSGQFSDDDHRDPAWNWKHAGAARDQAYCATCHTEQDCLACHAGAEKPREIHPGNWLLLHGRDAMVRPADCFGCHEGGVGCQKCHDASGVTESAVRDPLSGPARGRIHPEGWADFSVGSNHHGLVAASSIDSCASCHSEQECIRCHSTRTLRINPHPPGFNGSFLKSRNDAVCRKCHDTVP